MNPLRSLLSFLLLNIAMATSPFAGNWKLSEAYDENLEAVSLPTGTYTLRLEEKDPQHLKLGIKVGNNLRGQVTLGEGDDVEVSGLMSTMMMPAEPLYRLEMYFSRTFPQMTTMKIDDDTNLVFEGAGKIVFKSEE